jgi:hypothetical protein
LIKQNPDIIRIALHPRDPHNALEEQKQMISKLKDLGYMMQTYKEIVPKLQERASFSSLKITSYYLTMKPIRLVINTQQDK